MRTTFVNYLISMYWFLNHDFINGLVFPLAVALGSAYIKVKFTNYLQQKLKEKNENNSNV